MRCFDVISQRYPPLGCALLSAAALSLSIRSATTCQFLKISYAAHAPNEDGFIVPDEVMGPDDINTNEMDKYRIGILCPSQYFSREGDIMWNLSRYFIIASFALLGISLVYSWGLSTCFRPTHCNWKVLSVVSILAAGAQIPAFLMYASQPCQLNNARCASSVGFFMLMWSIVLLVVITLLTQCFDYPKWRQEMERWKVKEHDYPIYDHEDSFAWDMECEEPRKARSSLVQSMFSYRKKNKVKKQLDESEDHLNVIKRRKMKNANAQFYMLNSEVDVENASQCLSGLCVDLPGEEEHGPLDIVEQVSETLGPKECKEIYNEEWGEKIRARDLERAASEKSQVLTSTKYSPGRARVLKKGKSQLSYYVLDDDDEDSKKSHSVDHDSSSSAENSHYDLELNRDTGYKDGRDVLAQEVDTHSMVSSLAEDQVHIVDLSTGARETIVVDDYNDDTTAFVTKSFAPDRKQLCPPSPPAVVSDEEDNENDYVDISRIDNKRILSQLSQESDELETISLPKLLPLTFVKDDFVSGSNLKKTIQDDVETMPSNEHIILKFDKYSHVDKDSNRLDIMRDHNNNENSRWLDVLDTTVGKNDNHHVIKYQQSDDLDDEHDHMQMMMALRRSSLQTEDALRRVHHNSSDHTKHLNQSTQQEGVLVSDGEDEANFLGLNTRPRSTLYPDEVEV